MRTLHFEKVGDLEIVRGFSEPMIDPEATKHKIAQALLADPRFEPLSSLLLEDGVAVAEFEQLVAEHATANLVYFSGIDGERLIEFDGDLEWKFDLLDLGEAMLTDGSVVSDYRGRAWWDGDVRGVVRGLGESKPVAAVWEDELTRDELDRRMLTDEELAAKLLAAAVQMRQELEILGDDDALEKARRWYEQEKAK
jgi:hypothetical protein